MAAYVGLQDSAPRDALLGLHARVAGCEPDSWQDPALIQTYSPRDAVYVLPRQDFGVFTLGRLPLADEARRRVESAAERVCRTLGGRELRGGLPDLRLACGSGRIALRWTTSSLWVREVPRPELEVDEARRELCRRHLRRFAPTSPQTFAWWAGLRPADARQIWNSLADELLEVDFEGTTAWIRAADLPGFERATPHRGVRLLVEPDLRLLGRDRAGLFMAPGRRRLTPASDSFHPNGILINGRIVGAWGRRGSRVHLRLSEVITAGEREALAAEVAAVPITGAHPSPRLGTGP